MHFEVETLENGRKKLPRDKQTKNKVPLMFFVVKAAIER